MSRWATGWSRGSKPARMLSDFLNEGPVDPARTGNPTGTGTLSPAERAKQLGLQSNGKGGYIDPKTGQVVARTVNNELVFYSSAPGGGAVSDGSGGQALANPTSAWQDPITGLMVTPPSKAETPNEIAAIPDPVPAMAPAGYNQFIQQQKQAMYVDDFKARENAKIQAQMHPQGGMDQLPSPEEAPMGGISPVEPATMPPMAENWLPGDLFKRSGGMGPPTFSDMRDRYKRSIQQPQVSNTTPDDIQPGGSNPPPVQQQAPAPEPQPQVAPQPEQPAPRDPWTAELDEPLEAFQQRLALEKRGNDSEYVDLRGLLGDAQLPFAPRYLDMISRGMMANSKSGFSKLFPNLPMGAGSDKSRFGEIMSLVGAGLTPEQREIVFGAIERNLNTGELNRKGEEIWRDSPINKKWLKGARDNSAGIDKYLRSRNNGEMPQIERVAWDVPDELEGIGIGGEDGDEKGYSTDIAVRTPDGNQQLSLKADTKAMLVNSTANKYVGYILNAAAENEDSPHHEQAKAYKEWNDMDAKVKAEQKKQGKKGKPSQTLLRGIGLTQDQYDEVKDNSKKAEGVVEKYLSDKGLDHKKLSKDEHQKLEELFSDLHTDGVFDGMSFDSMSREPEQILRDTLEDAGFEDLDEDLLKYFINPSGKSKGNLRTADYFDNESNLPTAQSLAMAAAKAAGKPIGNRPRKNAKDYDKKLKAYEKKIADAIEEYGIEDKLELFDRYRDNFGEASESASGYAKFMTKLQSLSERGMSFQDVIQAALDGQLTAEDFGVDEGKDLTHRLEDLMYFGSMASNDPRAAQHKQNAVQTQRDFRKNFSKLIKDDSDLREGVLGGIRDKFPLKDVSENLETMIIGDNVLDNQVLKQILGTDNYDEIKDKLVVYEDDKGKSILGFKPQEGDMQYQVETPDRTIPIANITQRNQRPGRGGDMKHDMLFHKDFNKAIKAAQVALGLSESQVLELLINLTEDANLKVLLAYRLKSRYNR